ncbi:hypothetical protein [Inediibacterium massiliense]|uniref:hypothetical protein n=1 Tax=Inediibacterium massiliense TaxID=1658111 RepID=UPI0006B63F9B|nr:hypothetical protein [Inediibacterium massiliense]
MERCLLSIDWDYFIYTKIFQSCTENKKNIINLWYKRYIQFKTKGDNIEKFFKLSSDVGFFWKKIKKYFQISKDTNVYISDSHALSYEVAKKNDCNSVCLFDAHADLGYGGISSLDFEVNCANWLGKLLKDNYVKNAYIVYSPFTHEKPIDFKDISSAYDVEFMSIDKLEKKVDVPAIHICRSGAWTPPWLDEKFSKFIYDLKLPYKVVDCNIRKWNPRGLNFSDQIYYLMT